MFRGGPSDRSSSTTHSGRTSIRRRSMTSRTRIFTALCAGTFAVACQERPLTAPRALGLNAAKQAVAGEIPSTFAAAIALDTINQTITLPLYRGTGPRGERVFFILTESSDFGQAVKLGINWSPKLVNALGTSAVQRVDRKSTRLNSSHSS